MEAEYKRTKIIYIFFFWKSKEGKRKGKMFSTAVLSLSKVDLSRFHCPVASVSALRRADKNEIVFNVPIDLKDSEVQ